MKLLITGAILFGMSLILLIKNLRQKKTTMKIFSENIYGRINKSNAKTKIIVKHFLLFLSCAFLVQALFVADFDKDDTKKNKKKSSKKTVFVLDVSLSMISQDIFPSRLEKAKLYIMEIVSNVKNGQFALVPFAGSAFIQCPFTTDIDVIKKYLDVISAKTVRAGGTDLSSGIKMAQKLFQKIKPQDIKSKNMVIISDGADLSNESDKVYEAAAHAKIKTLIVGVGSSQITPIILSDNKVTGSKYYKWDKNRNKVYTKLEKDTLKRVANKLDGKYFDFPAGIIKELNKEDIAKINIKKSKTASLDKLFTFFVIFPLVLLILNAVITTRKRGSFYWSGRFEE